MLFFIFYFFFSWAYRAEVMNGQMMELLVFFFGIGIKSLQNKRLKCFNFSISTSFLITQCSIAFLINLFQPFRLWLPRRRSLSMKWWSVGRKKYTGWKCKNPRSNRWCHFTSNMSCKWKANVHCTSKNFTYYRFKLTQTNSDAWSVESRSSFGGSENYQFDLSVHCFCKRCFICFVHV